MQQLLQYETDNVIVGSGEVPAVMTKMGIAWVLPGGTITHNREVALANAVTMDRMIRRNLRRYKRRLFK